MHVRSGRSVIAQLAIAACRANHVSFKMRLALVTASSYFFKVRANYALSFLVFSGMFFFPLPGARDGDLRPR